MQHTSDHENTRAALTSLANCALIGSFHVVHRRRLASSRTGFMWSFVTCHASAWATTARLLLARIRAWHGCADLCPAKGSFMLVPNEPFISFACCQQSRREVVPVLHIRDGNAMPHCGHHFANTCAFRKATVRDAPQRDHGAV